MSTIAHSYGDNIQPGDEPVFLFPVIENYITLISAGTVIGNTVVDGASSGYASLADTELGSLQESAQSGQLGNLNVHTSLNGGPLIAGKGVLAEVGGGVYSYKADSSETSQPGSLIVVIRPTIPATGFGGWLCDVFINCRIMKPGLPIVKVTPESITNAFTGGTQSGLTPLQQFEQYVNQVVNNILGNQMATKPTFRKD